MEAGNSGSPFSGIFREKLSQTDAPLHPPAAGGAPELQAIRASDSVQHIPFGSPPYVPLAGTVVRQSRQITFAAEPPTAGCDPRARQAHSPHERSACKLTAWRRRHYGASAARLLNLPSERTGEISSRYTQGIPDSGRYVYI